MFDEHAVTNSYSVFKDDGGDFHLRLSSTSKLQMAMSPELGDVLLDPEHSSLSYGFEAVIPSDTTGDPQDIRIISMNYQLKTPE